MAEVDAGTPSGVLPGAVVLAGACIFMVKYVVGVDLTMAPRLVHDAGYALTVAALYGAFTGVFIGRASRLWRLALRPAVAGA